MHAAFVAMISCANLPGLEWNYVKKIPTSYREHMGDFDIVFNRFPTTSNGNGWWPVFKVDGQDELIRILGISEGVAEHNGVKVTTNISSPMNNYLQVKFIATSTDGQPHTIDLASYADVKIGNNDNAPINWYDGNRGITMEDSFQLHPPKLNLIVRDGYGVTNVDYFWVGEYERGEYHYWENAGSINLPDRFDSAFSIGWCDRRVSPNKPLELSVLIGVGQELKSPPIVKTYDIRGSYDANSIADVKVNLRNLNDNEKVYLYYNVTNDKETKTIKHDREFSMGKGYEQDETISINVESSARYYSLSIWATTESLLTSNIVEKEFLVTRKPAPKQSFAYEMKESIIALACAIYYI